MISDSIARRIAVEPRRVDWFRIVVDLERAGYTHWRIAAHIGRSATQVQAYKTIHTEPPFHAGMLLLGLWTEACDKGGQPPPFTR